MLDKPNIITADNIKICDFGLATRPESDNCLFRRCGTPGFVAPEIIKANSLDKKCKASSKSDIYSVGILLYLLLSRLDSS